MGETATRRPSCVCSGAFVRLHQLATSSKSIAVYRARTLHKLHLQTTADLIRYAVRHRLVE